ncbi:MAG: tyrosine-type recombinase/integrase [Janthinobacterium lividum]
MPAEGEPEARAPITVTEALNDYLADYQSRGGKALSSLRNTIEAHVRPHFGTRAVASLTAHEIKQWHANRAATAPRLRSGKDAIKPKVREVDGPDAQRARRSSANRILTVFRAALNLAFRDGRVATDSSWRRVKPFQRVDSARVRFLDDGEARRLVTACAHDLRRLVVAALLTGMRLGELAAIRVADLDAKAGTIHVPYAKGGAARHAVLTGEAITFFDGLASGRARGELMLLREDGSRWGKSQQHRPLHDVCGKAKIVPAVGFHILRHTHASRLARAGVPMLAIASQLGHANVAITQKHYAHLTPDHVAQAVRAGFSDMGLTMAPKDAPIVGF